MRAEESALVARTMLVEQLERRRVGEPVTMTLFGVTVAHFLLGLAVSAGLSIGTGLLMGALQSRQKTTTGNHGGQELSITRASMGTPWPEIFGGDPGDGFGGGIKVAPILLWLSRTPDGYVARKHISKQSSGGGKLGGPKAPDVTSVTYDLDALFGWCRGPATLKKMWAATDIILRNDPLGTTLYYQAEAGGNTLAGGASVVADVDASGGQAVSLPTNGSIVFNAVAGDGSANQLQFFYKSSIPIRVEFTWVGADGTTVFQDTLNSTDGVYAHGYHSAPWRLLNSTGNTVKVKNLAATPLLLDRLGVQEPGTPIGIQNTGVTPDISYDPSTPPDPQPSYNSPDSRLRGGLLIDPDTLGRTGVVSAGNFSNIAVYEGNGTELPDPVVQAQWDTQMGAGSTPGFQHAATTRLSNFFLTRYQEAFPPFWGLLEHKTIRTFKDLCEYLCSESGLLSTEYDFSDLATIKLRGIVVSPPFTAKELMTTLARIFNCYFYESDKIYGLRMESAPEVNLTDADLGWTDDDREVGDTIQLLDAEIPPPTEIARRVTMRYVSPARNYDQDQQNEVRQITTSQREATLDVQMCATDDEARSYAARELHIDEVESIPYTFNLSCEHLWRHPGTIFNITQADGTLHRLRLTSIKPTTGVVDCQGVQVDDALFTQFGTPSGITFEIPPVPIPAMTILGFYDNGPLRTADIGRSGYYTYAAGRTGPGAWPGATVYRETDDAPSKIATLSIPATLGTAVTKLGPIIDTSVEDTLKTFTVNATTDVFNVTGHTFINGETVMVSNSGGALPAPLSAATLYYVRDVAANTFKLALTAGGTAVNITTTGTGTNSVQRVIDVDLYGTDATLETVTPQQIIDGENACLFGDEVIQVRTWEQVAGFPNRRRGMNFTRAELDTIAEASGHTAGERFLLLDSAVQFVEQDIHSLNNAQVLHAVTYGGSYDDSAAINFAWTGGALKYPPPAITATRNTTSSDWHFRLFGRDSADPTGELYSVDIVGGRDFEVHGGISRPVTLINTPTGIQQPDVGTGVYEASNIVGNSVTAQTAYAQQSIEGERAILSFTYSTTQTLADTTDATSSAGFLCAPSTAFGGNKLQFFLSIRPQNGTFTPFLHVGVAVYDPFGALVGSGTVFSDTSGEASGTRYSVEFKDGKVFFYRNRLQGGQPFYVYTPGIILAFPAEVQMIAATGVTFSSIELEDEFPSLYYLAGDQSADFGSTQSTITVRGSQQRVVEGVTVTGRVTEVTFP
jgi:hypothetical protein